MYDDRPVLVSFRILYRSGPGDTYKVIQRRVPVEVEQFMNRAQYFTQALADIAPTQNGQYLVQDIANYESREFLVKTKPVITEL